MFKRTAITFLAIICASMAWAQAAGYKDVGAEEFKKIAEAPKGMLLDTRTKAEFSRSHIAGAQLIDMQDPALAEKLLALPKDIPLYLYCLSGARSRSVAAFLSQNGYAQVYNLQRGLISWNSAGYTLHTPAAQQQAAEKPKHPAQTYSMAQYVQLVSGAPLVFIDFFAQWCAPCMQMMPMIEQLEAEYKGRVEIVKINADYNQALLRELKIQGIPMLYLYKNGEKVYEKSGKAEKPELIKLFDGNLR
jgi:thioredoxin 1